MAPKSGLPDDDAGETRCPQPFIELMALERLDDGPGNSGDSERVERFSSLAVPFNPGESTRAFGGHVYAQSAYAASQTVESGFVINNMTGSWILAGRLDTPYVYSVRHIRDGKGYCTRSIDARQDGKICFSGICSFKLREKGMFNHQPLAGQHRFRSILDGKRPEDFSPSPGVDTDWWIEYINESNVEDQEFPGVDVRKVDMKGHNQTEEVKKNPEKYRQLHFYSLRGSPEHQSNLTWSDIKAKDQSGEYDNLYACAHLYACDRNSIALIPRALGHPNFMALASLTATVIFHQHGDALRMIDWNDESKRLPENLPIKWFLQEGSTPSSAENRAIYESRIWSPDGTLLGTTIQDSMLRLTGPNKL